MSGPLWRLEGVELAGRLHALDAEITAGTTAILGGSGAGKTSLIELLVGLARPTRGRITAHLPDDGRLPLFWSPQDEGLWPGLSVRRQLALCAPSGHGDRWLEPFGLGGVADSPPERLSAGERSRLAVARAMASEAAVLVMDEPLSALDWTLRRRAWDAVLSGRRGSLVYSTHDPAAVLGGADRLLAIDAGRLVWAGSVAALYERPDTPELAALLGPANWWAPGQAPPGVPPRPHPCVRPERVGLERDPGGPLVVARCRFAGAHAELDVEAGGRPFTVWCRPPGPVAPGERVALRWLGGTAWTG